MAGAASQGLIACGRKHAFLFLIACGGKKSIACGGKWASLMPGYIKPIACGSELLRLLHSRTQGRFYEERSDIVHVPNCDAFNATLPVVANMNSVLPWALLLLLHVLWLRFG